MPEYLIEPGLTIHYQDLNHNGNPGVMLLHGLGANSESWQLQTPALVSAGYRVIVPDLRGFGQSSYPGGFNNPKVMAADMVKLLKQLSFSKVHLIGISLGGTDALEMVIAEPALIESLIITNSFAKLRPKKVSLWLFYITRLILIHLVGIDTQADYVAKRLFPDPDQILLRTTFKHQVCQSNPSGYRSTMRALALFNISADTRKIQSPTLVITGENDSVVPPENQNELSALIPNAQQKVIRDAGHAVIVEKPNEFNQLILEFLQKQS